MFLPTFVAGVRSSHFIDTNNRCWAVGCNSIGQLGVNKSTLTARFTFTPLQLEGEAMLVSSGLNHTLMLDHQGNVKGIGVLSCCLNDTISQLGPISAIACGDFFSLGLSEGGEVYVKGTVSDYQVYSSPTRLLTSVPIKYMASGKSHLMLLDFEGSVWALGNNYSNQLGIMKVRVVDEPQKLANLPPMQSIACGGHHTLLLDEGGAVYGCGKNTDGQLGLGDFEDREEFQNIAYESTIQQIAAGGSHSLFLDAQGNAFACGNSSKGQTGIKKAQLPPPSLPNIKKIKKANKKLKKAQINELYAKECQLYNIELRKYQFACDRENKCFSLRKIEFPEQILIQSFSAGYLHSLFLDDTGRLWSCGDNENGQLATGDNVNLEVPCKIRGFEVSTTLREPITLKNARKD